VLLAALAQRALRDTQRRADFANVRKGLVLQQILKPGKDASMSAGGLGLLVGRSPRQALDQGVDQLVLQPVRRVIVGERSRARFGCTDGGLVEVAQLPQSRARGSPLCGRREGKVGSPQGSLIPGKVVAR
jgi:hypothetical protein